MTGYGGLEGVKSVHRLIEVTVMEAGLATLTRPAMSRLCFFWESAGSIGPGVIASGPVVGAVGMGDGQV